jgi:hypothetical protein
MDKDVSRAVEHAKKNPHQQFEIIPNNLRVRQAVGYHYTREPEYFAYIQHRYVENSLFEFFNRIEIRGDRVYIFSNQRDELYCITIKSKNFATTLKSIFLLQWTTATPLTKDVLATWSENYLREFEA